MTFAFSEEIPVDEAPTKVIAPLFVTTPPLVDIAVLEAVFIVIVPLFVAVEVVSTEIPTKLAPVFPSILPEFITSELLFAKIPADPAPDISIPLPVPVPLFVILDFSPIIPTELAPVIFTNPLFVTSDCVLACELVFSA